MGSAPVGDRMDGTKVVMQPQLEIRPAREWCLPVAWCLPQHTDPRRRHVAMALSGLVGGGPGGSLACGRAGYSALFRSGGWSCRWWPWRWITATPEACDAVEVRSVVESRRALRLNLDSRFSWEG